MIMATSIRACGLMDFKLEVDDLKADFNLSSKTWKVSPLVNTVTTVHDFNTLHSSF